MSTDDNQDPKARLTSILTALASLDARDGVTAGAIREALAAVRDWMAAMDEAIAEMTARGDGGSENP